MILRFERFPGEFDNFRRCDGDDVDSDGICFSCGAKPESKCQKPLSPKETSDG